MMNILVTGSAGFVGKNLVAALRNIRDGKDRTRGSLEIGEIFEYDLGTAPELLDEYCQKADFVFHLAGVNRTEKTEEFMQGNCGFISILLDALKKHNNSCPVMISSSIQASCIGRYDSDYGRSKKAGEDVAFAYEAETGAKVLVYRFTNLFGKWCRPNYNSVVATFCHNVANDLPITVNDPNLELELTYIDDLVDEMIDALSSNEHRSEADSRYCTVPTTHRVTLAKIASLLGEFYRQPKTLIMPEMPQGSFEKSCTAPI